MYQESILTQLLQENRMASMVLTRRNILVLLYGHSGTKKTILV